MTEAAISPCRLLRKIRRLAPQTLQRLLSNELLADEAEKKTLLKRLAGCFSRKDGSK